MHRNIVYRERIMKNLIICLLAMFCVVNVSAQKAKKSELKAQQYAEKYEKSDDGLSIASVVENIPLSRRQIFDKFNKLLIVQLKVHEDDIEDRNAMTGTVKASLTTDKLLNSGSSLIKGNLEIKLAAKEGKARIAINIKNYVHYRGNNVIGEEDVISRPPFETIDFNDEKSAKATALYNDVFLALDAQVEALLQAFNDFWGSK